VTDQGTAAQDTTEQDTTGQNGVEKNSVEHATTDATSVGGRGSGDRDGSTPGTPAAWAALGWNAPSRLARVEEHHLSNDWVPQLWESEDALLLVVDTERQVPVTDAGDGLRLVRPTGEYDSSRHFLLGTVDGAPRFVTQATAGDEPTAGSDARRGTLRDLAANLSDLDRDLAITAVALINWHRSEAYCPRCGTASEVRKAGFMRQCPNCGNQYFPRTDPAVIVAIIDDDDRLLLGRQPSWGNRVSVFAGFVEAGEAAEQAVHREMAEEVGLPLREVRYFGSQPWPFPRSLMLGFVARSVGTEVRIDGTEISYADWFDRDRLRREVADGTISLPMSSSIASRLVGAWLDRQL
jgi:NAD+ diphosphatase